MESANEIESATNNIKYYALRVRELSRKQLNVDVEKGHVIGVNVAPGAVRFDSLCCIDGAAEMIDVYCENIMNNLREAIKKDKELWINEEEGKDG
jgi:hypothetical protein